MIGSFLVPIVTPIVAIVTLAIWLSLIFWADAHPVKARTAAPGAEATGVTPPPAVEPGGEVTPPARQAA